MPLSRPNRSTASGPESGWACKMSLQKGPLSGLTKQSSWIATARPCGPRDDKAFCKHTQVGRGPALSKTLSLLNGPVRYLVRHRPGDGGRPGGRSSHSPSSLLPSPGRARPRAFTIVEVMMASVILVVGLIGMIQGITIGSEMMATARRQNIAAQILDHEIGKLRLLSWDVSGSTNDISGLTDVAAATYVSDLASLNTAIAASGVTFTLARTVTTVTTDLREVTFTVTWTKSGTTTAATTATGSWFNQLSFASPSPIARTYTRKSTAYFGKYGLNTKL